MQSRTVIISTTAFLTALTAYWSLIPGIGFLLEIYLVWGVVVATIERHHWTIIGASAAALILGAIPGIAVIPMMFLMPSLVKLVLPAMVIGFLLNRGIKATAVFWVAVGCMTLIMTVIYLQMLEFIVELIENVHLRSLAWIKSTLATAGYSTEIIDSTSDSLAQGKNILFHLLPGLMILTGIGQIFVSMVLVEWYFTRRDSYFPGFGRFIYWKMPEKLLYFWVAAILIRLIWDGTAQMVADNALLIFVSFYSVTGLSLLEYGLRKLRLPKLIRIIFYLGLFFMQLPGLIAAAAAGLFDSYFDFRKVRAHSLG
ncbi:MAG: DUF2232 domain-containing protein [candidate division Zixibacteria bacterium]